MIVLVVAASRNGVIGKDGRIPWHISDDLKRFKASMTAAEKASLKPINVVGAAALQRGRAVWTHGPEVTKARLAQEWMSWTLPRRCTVTSDALEKRAKLLGASFQVNAEEQDGGAAK